ncbi:hypothetical protein CSOJ01_14596 [Colletotrichum sojae]|uniref:Uncharacterized protein n=1 Tax=Colletotrichum sojae TaxID=2175907 RepID=A0A8H6IQ59_9PEZI|nr:hypothetical protein CSOJ01_14596 [Colletotrichum sojae]
MASLRRLLVSSLLLLGSPAASVAQVEEEWEKLERPAHLAPFPTEFRQPPPVSPDYMVDNTGNRRGVAPINV